MSGPLKLKSLAALVHRHQRPRRGSRWSTPEKRTAATAALGSSTHRRDLKMGKRSAPQGHRVCNLIGSRAIPCR
jgi:hypothetical protein